jgi:glycosyltransferase involved in cell wall biosynthesis
MVEEKALPAGHQRWAAAAMTTWETSRFPTLYSGPILDQFHIIVPSDFCAQSIANHMTLDTEDVKVVPHTFDPAWWLPQVRDPLPSLLKPLGAAPRDRQLVFYAMGAWSERKNHGAVVRAFLHAFEAEDNVRLALFSHNIDKGAIRSLMARSGISSGFPEITVDTRQYDDVLEMHHQGDVFVSASRGEGWGLPCFEAAVLGKTIISPIYSGERDYLLGRPLRSPATGEEYDLGGPRYAGLRDVGHTPTPCFAGLGAPVIKNDQIVGEKFDHVPGMTCRDVWAEPSVYDLAQRMRTVYEQHKLGHSYSGAPSRASLVERFGYDVVAQRLISTLERICR